MTTHTLEETPADPAAVVQEGRSVERGNVDQAPAEMSAAATPQGRRSEARMDERRKCSYEVLKAIEGKSFVTGRGEAVTLNQSTEGMLLLIAVAPHANRLIEVHTSRPGWSRTVDIVETRWTRPLEVKTEGNLYLVGCRRVFGPCHYLSF
jgi:hypothetical protein